MLNILVSDKLSLTAVQIFKDRGLTTTYAPDLGKDKNALLAEISKYDGLAIRSATKVTAKLLAAASKLKVVGRAGIGVDNVDIPAATAAGVAVMNTPFGNAITTAEHAIALMFSAARRIPQANESTHAGKWEKSKFMGVELYGKTLGLIGCGNIGSIVAARALGLQMKVVAYDPFLTPERALALGVEKLALEELLSRADFISLHTPLTDQTKNIISAENLARTKPGLRLINCARGGLIDETALQEALESGHVAAAALDVYAVEPAREHPLFGHENVICTPHLGASTREAQENVAIQVAEQMADYLLTGAVSNALNMPSVSAEEAPRLKPFIRLVESLGALVGQLTRSGVREIGVVYGGAVTALNTKPLTASAVAGILKPMLQGVNIVNAPAIARDRGIVLTETVTDHAENYESTIRLVVTTEKYVCTVTGALFGGAPRVVEIKGVAMEAGIAPQMLYVTNEDRPGLIGALGSLLADQGVNIATFNLGRGTEGAIALVAVDSAISPSLLEKVQALDYVKQAIALDFSQG